MQRRIGKLSPIFTDEVLISDSQFNSRYFRVSEVPQIFTAGKNKFKVYGNDSILLRNSRIAIQITDVNGDPIYHQVNNYVDNSGNVIITVFIYPETPPGLAKLSIMGVATKRPNGNPVSNFWADKYNVRWERDITIAPEQDNIEPVIFNKAPGVKVVENIREYLTQTYSTGLATTTQSAGTITYTKDARGGDATITITGASFTEDMNLGQITVPFNPALLSSNESLIEAGSGDYNSTIKSVVNSSTIKVQPYAITTQISEVGDRNSGTMFSTQQSRLIPNFTTTNYTASFLQLATYTAGTLNSQSFANITIKNLDPLVGKVHSIKTYMRSHGFNTYQLVGQDILPERDLLTNLESNLAYDRIGDYKSIEIINEYWNSGSVGESISFTNTHDDSEIISAMKINGADLLTSDSSYIRVNSIPNNIEVFKDNEYELSFKVVGEKNAGDINMLMDVYISGSNIASPELEGNNGTKLVRLVSTADKVSDVSLFSGVTQQSRNTNSPVGVPALRARSSQTRGGRVTVPGGFQSNTVNTVQVSDNDYVDERLLELTFTPEKDSDIHVVFVVKRGTWYISDVKLQGARDLGFTPNHTFIEIPIDVPRAEDILDFKFEFYNEIGMQSNITLVTESVDFRGSNLYISGNDNQLSGSVIVGNGIIFEGF